MAAGAAQACFTTRSAGDFAPPPPEAAAAVFALHRERYAGVVGHEVTWLRQVHGADVIVVTSPGEHRGATADAAITDQPGCALAVVAADCAPIVLHCADTPMIGVAHAGWRGLIAGVLERTVAAMRDRGANEIHALFGPTIHPECYEFGASELDLVVGRYGAVAAGRTSRGTTALNLPAAIGAALQHAGVVFADTSWCTACAPDRSYSFRARRDAARHAAIAWLEPPVVR